MNSLLYVAHNGVDHVTQAEETAHQMARSGAGNSQPSMLVWIAGIGLIGAGLAVAVISLKQPKKKRNDQ